MREGDWIKLWLGLIMGFVLIIAMVCFEEYKLNNLFSSRGYTVAQNVGNSGYRWVKP